MTVATATDTLELWRDGLAAHPGGAGEPSVLREQRERAMARFLALGFPTTATEEWRFTNVAAIAATRFEAAPRVRLTPADVERHGYPGMRRLVFVDGHYAPELSTPGALPAGVVLGSLAAAVAADPAVADRIGRHARFEDHAFVALNTALWRDGGYIRVPRGVVLDEPVHVLHVATGGEQPYAVFPRLLVVAEEASQLTLLESYAATGEGVYFCCPVTELLTGPSAVVRHTRLQREATEAFHVATFQTRHERASNLHSISISFGGRLVRNDVNAWLGGEGVDCTLDGLYLVTDSQFVDYHMRVDHAAPHCNSHELFKGILEGRGRSVFNGLIHVHPGAQKTDAKQSNRNLLLSPEAIANSNPRLEIFADDVKCTHGSTTGHLDENAVFYLRSRGIGEDAARSLLTYAFAHELLDGMEIEAVKRDLEEFLFARLPKGDVVRQAV